MKTVFPPLLALANIAAAHAAGPLSPLQPTPDHPVCLMRQYTDAHLAKNPRQKLSAIYVRMADSAYTLEDTKEVQHSTTSHVIGVSGGKFYGNDEAGCEFKADGSAHCQVDCDGGAFGLYPRSQAVLMQVDKNYYYPLYLDGFRRETSPDSDQLSFQGNDEDNNAYLLQAVPVEQCDRAIREMRSADFGC